MQATPSDVKLTALQALQAIYNINIVESLNANASFGLLKVHLLISRLSCRVRVWDDYKTQASQTSSDATNQQESAKNSQAILTSLQSIQAVCLTPRTTQPNSANSSRAFTGNGETTKTIRALGSNNLATMTIQKFALQYLPHVDVADPDPDTALTLTSGTALTLTNERELTKLIEDLCQKINGLKESATVPENRLHAIYVSFLKTDQIRKQLTDALHVDDSILAVDPELQGLLQSTNGNVEDTSSGVTGSRFKGFNMTGVDSTFGSTIRSSWADRVNNLPLNHSYEDFTMTGGSARFGHTFS